MGCCGCSLRTSVIVAAVFGMIESIGGGLSAIAAIFLIQEARSDINTTDGDLPAPYEFNGILISAVIENILWLVATISLIVGIKKESSTLHRLWVVATAIITFCDIILTVVLVVATVRVLAKDVDQYSSTDAGIFNALLVFVGMATHGSLILWITNIFLAVFTAQRANEILRGPLPATMQVFVYGGQTVPSFSIPGQVIFANSGPSYQPLEEFENKGYNPNLPSKIEGGVHPDQHS